MALTTRCRLIASAYEAVIEVSPVTSSTTVTREIRYVQRQLWRTMIIVGDLQPSVFISRQHTGHRKKKKKSDYVSHFNRNGET